MKYTLQKDLFSVSVFTKFGSRVKLMQQVQKLTKSCCKHVPVTSLKLSINGPAQYLDE